MNRVTLQCIVEGHGEVEAVPALLHRLVPHLCRNSYLVTRSPIHRQRSTIVRVGELERWVEFAARDLRLQGGILVLLDADDDLPCQRAPELLERAQNASRGCPVSVVLANREYEAWLIASAAALAGKSGFPVVVPPHQKCDEIRGAKEWLSRWRAAGDPYSPTLHQAELTRLINIDLARDNSPSFNKLCRDVQSLCEAVTARFGSI